MRLGRLALAAACAGAPLSLEILSPLEGELVEVGERARVSVVARGFDAARHQLCVSLSGDDEARAWACTTEPPNEGVRGRKLGSARGKVRASDAIKDAMAAWEEPPGAAAEEPTLKERTTDERALEERMLARAAEPPAAPEYSKPEKGRPKGLLGWLRRREGGDDAEAEGAAKLAESSRLREEIAWAKSQDMPELAADLTRKLLDL